MERGLTISVVTSVLLLLALTISLAVVASSKKSCDDAISNSLSAALGSNLQSASIVTITKADAICLTPGCIHTASKVLKNMNSEIAPCDDFYEFACGGFEKSNPIPDDKSSVNAFSMTSDKLQEQLRASIEEPSGPDEPRAFVLVKNLYKTCMNTTAIEKAGLEPLHKILGQLGKWPVLEGDKWKVDEFSWVESAYNFRKIGYSVGYFIEFNIGVDLKNSTKRIIELDQASLDLPREYLSKGEEDNVVKAYFKYMIDIAEILGAERQRATKELMESLEFAIKLANISLPDEKRQNFTVLYNPMTITELTEQYPIVNWEEYVNNLLPSTVRVDADEVVLVIVPSFIGDLQELLNTTPKRVQANYVMWRVVADSVSYLTQNMRKSQLDYLTVLSGATESKTRWKECVDIVSEKLSLSTGALYIRKHFKESAKTNVIEMVADIGKRFTKFLEKAEWMDEKTRTSALEKAVAMFSHVAYPDEFLNDKKLDEFYARLELSPNDLLGNILNLTLFETDYSFNELRKPVNKSDWTTHGYSAIVNAFYDFTENSLQIPAGILQGTFFSNERPRYMNYGSIGSVIGHEITHGFDNEGGQYDKEGNLLDWWAPETKEKYLNKAKCIIHQYGNYTVESVGLKLNGINTQGENIADNGGIKVAYLTYKEWVKRNGPEPRLPGLAYTPEQMFWISFANTWCCKYRPEELKLDVATDVHSPGRFRVLGPLSNRPEFAADFKCPMGSAMNAKQKCSVW